jgi:hypothetical protein
VNLYVELQDEENASLSGCRKTLNTYISSLGQYPEVATKIYKAESHEELIEAYLDWYYSHFLYHHRQQLVDMYRFLEQNVDSSDEVIQNALKDYFSINIIRIEGEANAVKGSTIKELFEIAKSEVEMNTISAASIQRSLEDDYNPKLDLFIILKEMRDNSTSSRVEERLREVWKHLHGFEQDSLIEYLSSLYDLLTPEYRMRVYNFIESVVGTSIAVEAVFNYNNPDLVYYAVMGRETRASFGKGTRYV